jgi:hypothetical protein
MLHALLVRQVLQAVLLREVVLPARAQQRHSKSKHLSRLALPARPKQKWQ